MLGTGVPEPVAGRIMVSACCRLVEERSSFRENCRHRRRRANERRKMMQLRSIQPTRNTDYPIPSIVCRNRRG